jgi:hypothetical protein
MSNGGKRIGAVGKRVGGWGKLSVYRRRGVSACIWRAYRRAGVGCIAVFIGARRLSFCSKHRARRSASLTRLFHYSGHSDI